MTSPDPAGHDGASATMPGPPGLTADARAAHARTASQVARDLSVDPRRGLDPDEARRRAAMAGSNVLERGERPSLARMVFQAATEPFVVLLLVAGLGAIALGEVRDGLLVLAGLIPIVGADVVTEYRGERALEALRDASAPRARVRRGGRAMELPAAELVPGDVVLVRVGDVVPADLRLTISERLTVDGSVLTGESLPEVGAVEPDPADSAIADRRCIAYAGTSVVGGRGEGLVIAIGPETELGRIAGGLSTKQRHRSPLQRELDRLVRILLTVAIGLITITTGLGFLRGNPAGENVLAGISAAIAAIPEEPPVLLAVVLGLGAYRLLRRGVLVRRLNAEEMLGAVDLVITDKTGTLTENRLAVVSVVDQSGAVTDPARRRQLLLDGLRAEDDAWRHDGDLTAASSFTRALGRAVTEAGIAATLDPADLVEVVPFAEDRPYTSTLATRDGTREALALGAPEAIAALAGRERADAPAWWQDGLEAAARRGERVVGLARRRGDSQWQLAAVIGFADRIRPGIRDAVLRARSAGIQVVMVTGDHPITARAIAGAAGLDPSEIVTGAELGAWPDEELARRLRRLSIVARSTPDQKRRIVEVARTSGRLVAVTGDGVNDAPALHASDVAVAMGSGTAVAREASDLVLGDDSFATLMFGLEEGRRIVDNIQKGLVFLVSTHVALLGFVLIATVAGFDQPLLPLQILWLELFIDLSTSVAFEREAPEPGLMTRPPRPLARPLLTRELLVRITLAGGFSAIAALGLLVAAPGGPTHGQWLAYTALVCAQAVRAYANRSLQAPVHRLRRNGFLLAAAVLVVVIQASIPFVPPLAEAFRAVPLTWTEWLLIGAVALAPALFAQVMRASRATTWVA